MEHLNGLILTGGGDHNPLWMGEPSPRLHNINQERDAAELDACPSGFQPSDTDAWHLPEHPDPGDSLGRKSVSGHQSEW